MRKLFNFFAAALVMLAAASCEKNEVLPDNNSEGKVVTLNASINNGGTKTSLGDYDATNNEYPVLWSKGDKIAVIQGNNIYEFTLEGEGGSSSGTFTCSKPGNFDPSQPYNAFYPFSYVSKENSEIKYTIPTTQTYAENSFASGSVPMVATSSNLNDVLEFTSLSGALKLQLKGTESIKSIEVVSDHRISGQITSDPYDKTLNTLFSTSNSYNYRWVTLDCGNEGVQLSNEKETNFIIAISKDGSYGGLFLTIIITDTKGNRRVVRTGLRQEITAENILKMPIVNYDPQTNEYIVVENDKSTYYGAGVEVGGAVWAPVNCGFKPFSSAGRGYARGKYYQWGRKDGHGYNGDDASQYTQVADESTLEENQDPEPNTIYTNWSNNTKYQTGWTNETNPCPDGWEVPSSDQMSNLIKNSSPISNYTTYPYYRYGFYGNWFTGNLSYNDSEEKKVFLQRIGYVSTSSNGNMSNSYGAYWTSSEYKYLYFGKQNRQWTGKEVRNTDKSNAYNIRCVKKSNP